MITGLLAYTLASSVTTLWTLQAETNGFTTYNQTIGQITGPKTLQGDDTEGRDCVLFESVSQEKGQESWDTPWPSDLAVLYYDFFYEPLHYGEPGDTFLIQSDQMKRIYATIQTDRHHQQWNGAFLGTAIRDGSWDSQVGWGWTSL